MLYNLLPPLAGDIGFLNLFRYLTFRTGGAVMTALIVCFVVGGPVIRWLKARLPASGELALVHGDFRLGNLIIGPEGVRSVLDWELGHVGDPMEDLAWLCVRSWRFGNDQLPVAGVGQREDLFRAYEAAGGRKIDPAAVHWWEVFGNLRWGVFCIMQARAYLDGLSQSVELATIGRRTAETEWELLNLMENG